MNQAELEAYNVIRSAASAHPTVAVEALMAGVRDAIQRLHERLGEKDAAFLAALALADRGRLSAATKECLNSVIVKAISPANACKLETDILAAQGREGAPRKGD